MSAANDPYGFDLDGDMEPQKDPYAFSIDGPSASKRLIYF